MKVTELKTGTKLELEVFDFNNEKINPNFSSQFEVALDEKTAIVAAPIYEGNIYPMRIGWHMNVYFRIKNVLCTFKAVVLKRETIDNIAYLRIGLTSEIEEIQRRNYFRFECSVPVKYRVLESENIPDEESDEEKEKQMKPAITADLSGGGVCIRLNEKIEVNKEIEGELDFGEGNRKINFTAKVVRCTKLTGNLKYEYEIGTLFKQLENRDREYIIRFIFKEQRRLRKKELM